MPLACTVLDMAERESLSSRFKNITSSLQKIVECPICLDTIKVPFKLCGRGHGICSSCSGSLRKCPTCEAYFVLENPICLKNLLEALPHFCSFSDNGCEEILSNGSEHDSYCGYRPIVCRQHGCDRVVPLIKVMGHYNKDHPAHYIYKTGSFVITWYNFDPSAARYEYVPISLFNNAFWILIINDTKDKYLKLYFQVTPIGKMRNEYFAQVKFEQERFVFISTIKASVLISCETKYQNEGDSEEESNVTVSGQRERGEFMAISHSSLNNLITDDEDHKLKCQVGIFDKRL